MKRLLTLFIATISLTPPVVAAQSETVSPSGKPQISHTRLAPVVVHRMFPPFKGQHVYQGRRQSGTKQPASLETRRDMESGF